MGYVLLEVYKSDDINGPTVGEILEISPDYGGNQSGRHNYIVAYNVSDMKMILTGSSSPYNTMFAISKSEYDRLFSQYGANCPVATRVATTGSEQNISNIQVLTLAYFSPSPDDSKTYVTSYAAIFPGSFSVREISTEDTLNVQGVPIYTTEPQAQEAIGDGTWSYGSLHPDPFDGAGNSGTGGGGGNFNYASDPPDGARDDADPSISVVDTGFITLFNPTIQELKQLAQYLWSGAFDLNNFKRVVNNPMDLIMGLSMLPVPIPNGQRVEVGLGLTGSGVYMTKASSQWVTVYCGSVDLSLKDFSVSYLDFDPYTSVEIYLPFIGSRTLKADEVMGHVIELTYKVDILSGSCVAWVDAIYKNKSRNLYAFMGQCAQSLPVTSGDWTNMINGIISVIGGAVGGAAVGGAAGAIAGGLAAASSAVVNDSKINVERTGSIGSGGGFRGPKHPYVVINTPNICKPDNQAAYEGYPAYFTQQLAALSGFTIVESVNVSNIPATEAELTEIKDLLLSGVIL